MNDERLNALLAAAGDVRLAVVGDYFLDRYGRGRISGVSRETGRRILRLHTHTFSPGGTGNVAANAAAFGASVAAVGVLGDDAYARTYRDDLAARGIDVSHLATDAGRHTASFEKFLVERPGGALHEVRLDVDNRTPVSDRAAAALCASIEALAGEVDGFAVADYEEYGAGTITPSVLDAIRAVARGGRVPCFAMSRTRIADLVPCVPVQNEYEIVTELGAAEHDLFDAVPDDEVKRAVALLIERGATGAYVTRGDRGISVFDGACAGRLVPTMAVTGATDTCGAGDTVLAVLAASVCAGADPVEAACIANAAARVTVRKLGTTGTATPDEIRDAVRGSEAG